MDSSIHFHYTRLVNPDKIDELWSCDRLPDDDIDPELLTQTSELNVLFQTDPVLASTAPGDFSSADDDLFVNSPTTSVPFAPALVGRKSLFDQQHNSLHPKQTVFLSSPFSRQNEQFPSASTTANQANPNDNSMVSFLNSPFDANKYPNSSLEEEMSIDIDDKIETSANIGITISNNTTTKHTTQTPPSPLNKKRKSSLFEQNSAPLNENFANYPFQQNNRNNAMQIEEETTTRSHSNPKKRRTIQNFVGDSDLVSVERMKIDGEEEDELMDHNSPHSNIKDKLIRKEDQEFENWLEKRRKKGLLDSKKAGKQNRSTQHLLFEGNPEITENWKIDQKLDLLNALLTTEDDVAVDEDQQPPHMAFMNEMIGAGSGAYGGLSEQMLDFTMTKAFANQNSWGELALGAFNSLSENEGNEQ